MIESSRIAYGRSAMNKMDQTKDPSVIGARMLVESFYYAFNHRDLAVFRAVWAAHDLIQLNNPLGGILRGDELITALYERVFSGPASVWVELSDVVEFQTENMVVFAGREAGEFTVNGHTLMLSIRTSRVVQWLGGEIGWKQVHHHGSIDNPKILAEYQQAVLGKMQ